MQQTIPFASISQEEHSCLEKMKIQTTKTQNFFQMIETTRFKQSKHKDQQYTQHWIYQQ